MIGRLAALVLLASAGVARAGDIPLGRLPSNVVPLAYRINLREDPAQTRFTGHVEIDIQLTAPTRSFYLNGRDLTVTNTSFHTAKGDVAATYTQVAPVGVARIDLATMAPAGRATLTFEYSGDFRENSDGLYHLKSGGAWYSYTQFEEINARRVFPSFDEPGFKTPYTIGLDLPAGLKAVSNAPELSAEPVAGGWVRHRFAPTLPLPTYLVAMMAGPFATASKVLPATTIRPSPLPIRVVAPAPQAAKLTFAVDETGPIVSLLEDYFGTPFPFPKLDQIATPAWQSVSAMENAGADTYANKVILLDAGATTAQKRDFGMTVGHELSHQWFGDLVTPVWWSDIWLNESFAEWMGYRIGDAWRPALKIGDGATAGALRAMDLDSLLAGRPIRQPIALAEDAETAFDEVTYDKGAQVVTQTAAYLGDATFRAGVRLHISRHRYGNANSDQFFAALSDAAHDPRVAASMRSFVDQPGVPLVTFVRNNGRWTATQSRYTLLGEQGPSENWGIPLCVRPLPGQRQCVLADQRTTVLPSIGAGLFMPNAGGKGYYRFELPDVEWRALIARLGELPAAEALMANDSLWASFEAGRASPTRLIEAARRLTANASSSAVLDGASRLSAWRRHGLVTDQDLPAYQRLMASIYGPRLGALGLNLSAGAYDREDPDRRALREGLVSVAALEARDGTVRSRLSAGAAQYLGGDLSALDQGFLTVALTVYLQEHDPATSRALLTRAVASDDVVFKPAALDAVGAGSPVKTADDVVALVFAPGLKVGVRGRLAGDLLARADVRPFAQPVILSRVTDLGAAIPTVSSFDWLGSFDQACSDQEANAFMTALRSRTDDIPGGALALDRMGERVRTCAILKAQRGSEISRAIAGA